MFHNAGAIEQKPRVRLVDEGWLGTALMPNAALPAE